MNLISKAPGKVTAPAIALLVVGGLNILRALYLFVQNLRREPGAVRPPGLNPDSERVIKFVETIAGPGGIFIVLFVVGCSALILFGAWKLLQLEGYGLAIASSFLVMVPCISPFPICLIGIGVGIWSLVILSLPDVRRRFR